MIASNLVSIKSHEFNFNPFGYKLNLEGKLEIKSPYKFSTKTLVGKLNLPNQRIDLIDIVPNILDKCKSELENCSVYTFKTYISLAKDSYFAREFDTRQNIPFEFNIDFDSSNKEIFKLENPSFSSLAYEAQNKQFSNLVAQLKKQEIKSSFAYQNSFKVERTNNYKTNFSLHIPSSWSIKNGFQINKYEDIDLKLNTYSPQSGYYIKDWFKIKTKGKVTIADSFIEFQNGSTLKIPTKDLKQYISHDWTAYSLNGTVKKKNLVYQLEYDNENSGIYLPEVTTGSLNAEVRVLINNHIYVIKVKNPFSFKGKYWLEKTGTIRVWIETKYDQRFSQLSRFKYFQL